jgi:hypothetical protein
MITVRKDKPATGPEHIVKELSFSSHGVSVDQHEWIATDNEGNQYTEQDSTLIFNMRYYFFKQLVGETKIDFGKVHTI